MFIILFLYSHQSRVTSHMRTVQGFLILFEIITVLCISTLHYLCLVFAKQKVVASLKC